MCLSNLNEGVMVEEPVDAIVVDVAGVGEALRG
jgi:hypothetical protein